MQREILIEPYNSGLTHSDFAIGGIVMRSTLFSGMVKCIVMGYYQARVEFGGTIFVCVQDLEDGLQFQCYPGTLSHI